MKNKGLFYSQALVSVNNQFLIGRIDYRGNIPACLSIRALRAKSRQPRVKKIS